MTNITATTPLGVVVALADLGSRIAIARRARHLRQKDLCEQAAISRSTLVEIEKGSPFVSMGNYCAVMWALDLLPEIDRIGALESETSRLLASDLPRRVRST